MRTLLSRQLVRPRALFPRTRNANIRRPYSANTQPPSPPEASEAAAAAARKQSRLDRVISRLPGRLQRYLSPLRSAPLTHVTAFLLLHEITAIVPLVGLAATFHYADWLPPYISEGAWVKQGEGHRARLRRQAGTAWTWGEGGVRLLVEVATAWAVTKALLPLRLGLSVWATPWFARVALQPVGRGFKRIFGGGRGKAPGGGAGKS
ncbi:putative mitochondrial seryl-trna synthetase protein [Lasiodiplodia theobromae]|nr:putative mitochondrial seryl-trna synthetase protein [Lasiodiplodia theobromae]